MKQIAEKKGKNVLLTTFFSLAMEQMTYCVTEPYNWHRQYCTMILPAEASAKQILSLNPIDEIVVIGDKNAAFEKEENTVFKIADFEDTFRDEKGRRSQFGYFCYRMKNYLENKDPELDELLNSIPPERQAELEKMIQEGYLKASNDGKKFGINRLFDESQKDGVIADTSEAYFMQLGLTPAEEYWWVAKVYQLMTDSLKGIALDTNMDTTIRFVPAAADNLSSTDNISAIIGAVVDKEGEDVHIIADLHALSLNDAYSILSTLSMMTSVYENHIFVDKMLCVDYDELNKKPAARLYDWNERFAVSELVAAVDTFKKYGKAEPLETYWKKYGEDDPVIEELIYAMKSIDAGISLCHISEMEYGIERLKNALNEFLAVRNKDSSFVSDVFYVLMYGLSLDYGELLTTEKPSLLALLKWCERKKLYQQAFTLLEARLPQYLVDTGLFYYCKDDNDATRIMDALTQQYFADPVYTRYKYKDIDHYMVKFYGRSFMRRRGTVDEKSENYTKFMKERIRMERAKAEGKKYEIDPTLLERSAMEDFQGEILGAYSLLDDLDLFYDILLTYYLIGNLRNAINHASNEEEIDFSDSRDVGDSQRLHKVVQMTTHFISRLEKALDKIKDKEYEVYRIDGKDFFSYAEAHRPPKEDNFKKDNFKKDNSKKEKGNGPKILGNIRNMLNTKDKNQDKNQDQNQN